MGQWGEEIPSAPYVLEPLIDAYATANAGGCQTSILNGDVSLVLQAAAGGAEHAREVARSRAWKIKHHQMLEIKHCYISGYYDAMSMWPNE